LRAAQIGKVEKRIQQDFSLETSFLLLSSHQGQDLAKLIFGFRQLSPGEK
jgi:hypothetical protein